MFSERALPFGIVHTASSLGRSVNSWVYDSTDVHCRLNESILEILVSGVASACVDFRWGKHKTSWKFAA